MKMDEKDEQIWQAIRSKLLIDQELMEEWKKTKEQHHLETFAEYIDRRIIPIMQEQVEIREKEGYRML